MYSLSKNAWRRRKKTLHVLAVVLALITPSQVVILKVQVRLFLSDLLVSGDASVDGGVDDSVQRHAEQVDVAVQLLVLVLADQSPQLLVLILHYRDGVF